MCRAAALGMCNGRAPFSMGQYSSCFPCRLAKRFKFYGTGQTSICFRIDRQASTVSKSLQTRFQPADRLLGRTCLITGGSSGIGFSIAERFLQEGAKRLILVGRSHDRLSKAAGHLQRAVPGRATSSDVATRSPEEDNAENGREPRREITQGSLIAITENISLLIGDVSLASQWMRELEKAMEDIDILVNAAGISISNILPRTDLNDISKMLSTNLEGAILTSRALLRACMRSRLKKRSNESITEESEGNSSKCIINISSLLALKGVTGTVTYAASKAGLLGLTRSVAVEAAETVKGIAVRSNAIIPGYIETPIIEDFRNDQVSRLKESIPLKRFGYAQEIADAAVFLANNEYANNCVLNLDGGLNAV